MICMLLRLALALVFVMLAVECNANDDSPMLVQIKHDWQARQARVTSARFTWRRPHRTSGRLQNYQVEWLAKDVDRRHSVDNELLIYGHASRYESDRWYCLAAMEFSGLAASGASLFQGDDVFFRLYFHDTSEESFQNARRNHFGQDVAQRRNPRRFVSLRDGTQRIDYFAKGDGLYAQIMTYDLESVGESLQEIIDSLYFRSLLLTYRPLGVHGCHINLDAIRLRSTNSYVNGRVCAVVEVLHPNDILSSYWVDVERNSVILREITEKRGSTRTQLDISYRHDLVQGWVPNFWSALLFAEAKDEGGISTLIYEAVASVETAVVNDASIGASMRIPSAPSGTLTIDCTKQSASISTDGERPRVISRAEAMSLGASYKSLTSGPALMDSRWLQERAESLRVMIAMTILFLTTAFIFVRRRNAMKSGTPLASTTSSAPARAACTHEEGSMLKARPTTYSRSNIVAITICMLLIVMLDVTLVFLPRSIFQPLYNLRNVPFSLSFLPWLLAIVVYGIAAWVGLRNLLRQRE